MSLPLETRFSGSRLRKKRDHPLAPDEPALELETRDAEPHDRHRGGDRVLEGALQLLRHGAQLAPRKTEAARSSVSVLKAG